MGIEQNTFIGPAIKCMTPSKTINRQGRRCPNEKCKNHKLEGMNSTFCPTCGTKVKSFPIPEPLSMFQILEDEEVDENQFFVIHEDMCELDDGITVLTDNYNRHGAKNGVLTAKDINEALAEFIEKFKVEIPMLKKYYDSVIVDYMVFTYYI